MSETPSDNQTGKVHAEAAEKLKAEDSYIAKTFSTPTGRKTLEWLKSRYVESGLSGYVVDRNGGINAEATTFEMWQKEGQRVLVRNIEMRIKRANSG